MLKESKLGKLPLSGIMRDGIADRSFATIEGFGQEATALDISALQQQVASPTDDTTSSFGAASQHPTNTMEELRRSILSLSAHDMANLFLKNEMLRTVLPLEQGIQRLTKGACGREQHVPLPYPRHPNWPVPIPRLKMGRLPSLTFGRYNLNDDFLAFLCDLGIVADAYAAPEAYRIS